MRIIEIQALPNGAHRNQTINGTLPTIPKGWAVVPDGMATENFPFGEVEVEDLGGVPTVTTWTPGTLPEPAPAAEPKPTTSEILDALLGVIR